MGTEVVSITALELRYRKLVETLPSSVVFVPAVGCLHAPLQRHLHAGDPHFQYEKVGDS